jgi:hypothetical protein
MEMLSKNLAPLEDTVPRLMFFDILRDSNGHLLRNSGQAPHATYRSSHPRFSDYTHLAASVSNLGFASPTFHRLDLKILPEYPRSVDVISVRSLVEHAAVVVGRE